MLNPKDQHINQIVISVTTIIKYGSDLLGYCGCLDDVLYILDCIKKEQENNQMVSLNERKLNNCQDKILNLYDNYSEFINSMLKEDLKEIREIPEQDLHNYVFPHNLQE